MKSRISGLGLNLLGSGYVLKIISAKTKRDITSAFVNVLIEISEKRESGELSKSDVNYLTGYIAQELRKHGHNIDPNNITGNESLNEDIEKGSLHINFAAHDNVAKLVADKFKTSNKENGNDDNNSN
ncbi:hypothetical protein [Serratia sp. 14-2641]|uniref:hypothetical protein n=1 Tax=Serratia sp. 14-2641 TaxID=1841657 RepID=UPI00080FC34C|nr:hypothetical protein [Serratia sp. 14-2641]OCJ37426.1 hypothetical protein A6U95_25295 [Serratia sp. 14-2641]